MKKLGRKQVIVGMLSAAMVLGSAMPALAAQGWNQNQTGWWYENSDGSYVTSGWREINGAWYYFNAAGYMATGWVQDSGRWFFNDASGAMLTGWINVGGEYYYLNPVSDGSRGAMVIGEAVIDGATYYFNESGACTNTFALSDSIPRYYTDGVRYDKANHPSGGGSGSGGSSTPSNNVPTKVKETNEKVAKEVDSAIEALEGEGKIGEGKAILSVTPPATNTEKPTITLALNKALAEDTMISDVGKDIVSIAESLYDSETMETIEYLGHPYTEDEMDKLYGMLRTATESSRNLNSLKGKYEIKVTLRSKEVVTYTINVKFE